MKSQRSKFLGESQVQNIKKDAPREGSERRRFRPIDTAEVEIKWDNTTVTQFGGYPAWDCFCRRIGLNQELSRAVRLDRGKRSFTPAEVARSLVDAKVLGAARISHIDTMRADPLLCDASGLEVLPSSVTIGRFLKEHSERQCETLRSLNERMVNKLFRAFLKQYPESKREELKRVVVDYDSTTFTVYGKQEGADRGYCFRKKGKPGFQPRFAFMGGLGVVVNHELRPQSNNLDKDFLEFHRETLRKVPKGVKVWAVRGDAALYSQRIIQELEKDELVYAISAAINVRLKDAICDIPEEDWVEGIDEKGRPYSIARIRFKPKTWEKERTYIISRRLKPDALTHPYMMPELGYKYHAYVTNYGGSIEAQYKFAVDRASLEANIKECKRDMGYNYLPCAELTANKAYLEYVILARNLSIFFRLHSAPPEAKRWTLGTFRARVLRICANIVRKGSRYILSLPAWWPYRTIVQRIFDRALALAPL